MFASNLLVTGIKCSNTPKVTSDSSSVFAASVCSKARVTSSEFSEE